MIKPVVQKGKKILNQKTQEITNFSDPSLKDLIRDMYETVLVEDGVGLAAPQINSNKRVFIIPEEHAPQRKTIKIPSSLIKRKKQTVFINPKIISYSEETIVIDEGCLSLLNKFYLTPRFAEVVLTAQDEKGRKFKVKAGGLLARIFQHETDHLDGILFIDRINESLSK